MWCGLRLQRSAGLIQSREAAHDAMTGGGKKKKLENPLEKEIRMEKPRGEKSNSSAREGKQVFFSPFFSRALLEDTEERRRGTGAGKISEGRVEGGRRGVTGGRWGTNGGAAATRGGGSRREVKRVGEGGRERGGVTERGRGVDDWWWWWWW